MENPSSTNNSKDIMMKEQMNFLFSALGSHHKVAALLGYDERYYRKIRKRVEAGERISERVKIMLEVRARELHFAGAADDCR
jgi:hypothetical protein